MHDRQFENKNLLKKEGNSLVYTLADGVIIKQFRKAWERNDNGSLDKVMLDFVAHPNKNPPEAEAEAVIDPEEEFVE